MNNEVKLGVSWAQLTTGICIGFIILGTAFHQHLLALFFTLALFTIASHLILLTRIEQLEEDPYWKIKYAGRNRDLKRYASNARAHKEVDKKLGAIA